MGTRQLARRQTVECGDLARQRAQRSRLDVLLMRGLLEVRVVLLQRVVVLPKLVEAGGLDQHSRVRAGQSGDGKHADGRGGYEKISIVKGDRNLIQVAVFVAADEHDVVTLFKLQAETLAQNLTAKQSRGSERSAIGEMIQANEVHQSSFQNCNTLLSVLCEGNKLGTLVQPDCHQRVTV